MKTISRIAYSNDKKNKTRSILIMMAICLTTMLLVIISTVGNGDSRRRKALIGHLNRDFLQHLVYRFLYQGFHHFIPF